MRSPAEPMRAYTWGPGERHFLWSRRGARLQEAADICGAVEEGVSRRIHRQHAVRKPLRAEGRRGRVICRARGGGPVLPLTLRRRVHDARLQQRRLPPLRRQGGGRVSCRAPGPHTPSPSRSRLRSCLGDSSPGTGQGAVAPPGGALQVAHGWERAVTEGGGRVVPQLAAASA